MIASRIGPPWVVAAIAVGCAGPAVEVALPDTGAAEEVVRRAVEDAAEEVRTEPDSAAAWAALGDRLHAHAWDAEAASCYARAEILEPQEFSWPYMRAVCLADTDLAGAAAALARAIEIDPDYAPAHVRYGKALVDLGWLDEAEPHFEIATRAAPGNPHAWLGRARVAMARSDFLGARSSLERALDANPNLGEVHRLLAQTHLALNDPDAAARHAEAAGHLPKKTPMADSRAARAVAPAGSMANNDRGIELVREGRPGEAVPFFEEALRINPEFAEAHYNLGTLLARGGRLDEAIRHLEDAVRLGPANADSRVNLGIALASRGDRDRATTLFREALAIDPDHVAAHVRLGTVLESDGATGDAIAEYRRALAAQPDAYEPAFRLAWILATHPDPGQRGGAEAVRLAELACAATEFGHASALDALAAAYAETGRFTDAVTAARKAARLTQDPDLAAQIRERVALFESGRPFRETPE